MAEGIPIDAFKALPVAFENRFDLVGESAGRKQVTVVLNDPEMTEEQKNVQRIYSERAAKLSIDVEIQRELTTQGLAQVFERPKDFVHYIGHCDEGGLRCSDGQLPISCIKESKIRTFFLNACNSYREGIELIKKGSIAGGVTLKRVLDQQASRVGTLFSKLVIHGFSIERALSLARRQAIVSKGYTTVGDGTFKITQSDIIFQTTLKIQKISDDEYKISMDVPICSNQGSIYQPNIEGEGKYLSGEVATFQLTKPELKDFLELAAIPAIYKGQLFWTDELYKEL